MVAKIREQRAQAQAQQAQMEQAAMMVQGAQALGNTPIGKDTALGALMGGDSEAAAV